MESLSIRKGRSLHIKLCIIFSVFVDVNGHKPGQTSLSVVGNEIQTNRNFKAHMYHYSYFLDFFRRRCNIFRFAFSNKHWYDIVVILSRSVISIASYTKIYILHSQTSSGSSTRSCSTTAEPTKCAKHSNIQEGSKQCTLGAVSICCSLCTKIYTAACDHL